MHSRDHNGDILRAWRRCDGAGTTATFDGVALGGQCHQQLDGDGERLGVADKVDEMASRLTTASRTRAVQRRLCRSQQELLDQPDLAASAAAPTISGAPRRSGVTMVFSGGRVLVVSQRWVR